MTTDTRPTWQLELLLCAVWTRHQFLSALCGGDSTVAATSPDEWDVERRRAERTVDAAITAGELTVSYFHAVTEESPYGDYHVSRDAAIQWAAGRLELFLKFPFTLKNLQPSADDTGDATGTLPPQDPKLTDQRVPLSINEAAERLGVSDDTIRRMGKSKMITIARIGGKTLRVPQAEIDRILKTGAYPRH